MKKRERKYTCLPAELSSEIGERKFSPTAHSPTAPPSTKSHVSCCEVHAHRGARKWHPKVHSAGDRTNVLQSMPVSAVTTALVPTRPIPLLLCSPLQLSIFDQIRCIQTCKCDCVHCTQYATNFRRATLVPKFSASYMWDFPYNLKVFLCSGWATGSLNLGSKIYLVDALGPLLFLMIPHALLFY